MKPIQRNRLRLLAAALAPGLLPAAGWADTYPSRPIKLIVTFAPAHEPKEMM